MHPPPEATVPRLGRCARPPRARRALEHVLAAVYGGGWAARVARLLRLQGHPQVAEHVLELDDWPAEAPPLRVAFASDFHAGPTTHPATIAAACDALARAQADVLLLGGDFVSLHARHASELARRLGDVPASHGRFAVLGNHDLVDDAFVAARLADAGITVLCNDGVRLAAPWWDVWICGLDDPTHGVPDADRALDGAAGTRVVLMHSPDGLLALGERPFAVALCGHTHAGQVAMPGGRAPVVPEGRLSRRYLHGLYTIPGAGDRRLLVSAGVGCSTVPVRAFAAPQVHVCVLRGPAPPDPASSSSSPRS